MSKRNKTTQRSDKPKRCFVILPFAGEFEDIYHYAIVNAARAHHYICERVDDTALGGRLLLHAIQRIASADLIIADVSEQNPNIYYELGIVHTLGLPLLTIARTGSNVAFDLTDQRVLIYDSVRSLEADVEHWIGQIEQAGDSEIRVSPVHEAISDLNRVPKEDLEVLQAKLDTVEQQLHQKQKEIEVLRSSSGDGHQLAELKLEIAKHIKDVSSELLGQHTQDLVSARAEAERLRHEVERLVRFEQEVRRLKEMTLVNPHWSGRNFEVEMDLCFLLMPFREAWSDDAWTLIDRVVTSHGMRCRRADEQEGRVVMDDVWEGVSKARVVIADLTAKNANVTYEVGLADVLGKEVILLSQNPDDVPFDFLGLRLITYENSIGGARKLTEELGRRLERFS